MKGYSKTRFVYSFWKGLFYGLSAFMGISFELYCFKIGLISSSKRS